MFASDEVMKKKVKGSPWNGNKSDSVAGTNKSEFPHLHDPLHVLRFHSAVGFLCKKFDFFRVGIEWETRGAWNEAIESAAFLLQRLSTIIIF